MSSIFNLKTKFNTHLFLTRDLLSSSVTPYVGAEEGPGPLELNAWRTTAYLEKGLRPVKVACVGPPPSTPTVVKLNAPPVWSFKIELPDALDIGKNNFIGNFKKFHRVLNQFYLMFLVVFIIYFI